MALVALAAQGQTFAYVANAHSNSVSVIDTASNKVVAR
jgi:YVTN family beta-propeller protein